VSFCQGKNDAHTALPFPRASLCKIRSILHRAATFTRFRIRTEDLRLRGGELSPLGARPMRATGFRRRGNDFPAQVRGTPQRVTRVPITRCWDPRPPRSRAARPGGRGAGRDPRRPDASDGRGAAAVAILRALLSSVAEGDAYESHSSTRFRSMSSSSGISVRERGMATPG